MRRSFHLGCKTLVAATAVLVGAVLAGCQELPEVEYETDRLEVATYFDAPLCRGTLDSFDEHVDRIEDMLGIGYASQPIRVYWLSQAEIEDRCGADRGGCFYPATRVVFTRGQSLRHELVHAVLDSEGESYFVEEGMAEMLSGVGVYFDVSDASVSPAKHLSLSRSEYRRGGLDYDAAAHFIRWVYETAGPSAMLRLADEIEARSTAAEIENTLEAVVGDPMQTIEDDYRTSAPNYYAGLAHGTLSAPSWETLEAGLKVRLDCAAPDTFGPLPQGDAGLYRVFRIIMPSAGVSAIEVEGPEGTFVELIDPLARLRRGLVQDWTQPDSRYDPKALRVYAGERTTPVVKDRTYLLVVASQSPEPADVRVRIAAPASRYDGQPHRSLEPNTEDDSGPGRDR